jgi:hypothetical protein
MKEFNNERGFVKFFLTMLILAFAVYAGYKFGMPYYKYSAFKSEARALARISVGDIDRTRALIFEKAEELGLPLTEKDIEVRRLDKTILVQTSWSERVDLLGFYQKDLYFTIDLEE